MNTSQQFTNHCGNKGSIVLESHLWLLALFHFRRDDLMNSWPQELCRMVRTSKFTFYAFKDIHQEVNWTLIKREFLFWCPKSEPNFNFSSTLYVRNTKPLSLICLIFEPLMLSTLFQPMRQLVCHKSQLFWLPISATWRCESNCVVHHFRLLHMTLWCQKLEQASPNTSAEE